MSVLTTSRRAAANERTITRSYGTTIGIGASGVPVRYTDTGRTRLVIQNPTGSGVTILVGRGTDGSLNPPGSYPDSVPAGSQWRADNPGSAPVWFKESTGGTASVVYYTEQIDGTGPSSVAATIEAIPAAIALPAPSVTYTDGGNKNAFWMSADGATLYGGRGGGAAVNTTLSKSVDDGANWTTVHTFTDSPLGMCETNDGEVLVACYTTAGSLWKSSGWASNPATATWSKVLDSSGVNCYFRPQWGLHQFSTWGAYVVASEYGIQTASGFTNPAATKVWLSTDHGATWSVIYDLLTTQPGAYPLHMHASSFDPHWPGRIWLTFGDGGTSSTPNSLSGIVYSDDLGANWTTVPGTGVNSATNQVTTIIPLKDCILFLPDGAPFGVQRLIRGKQSRTIGSLHVAHLPRGGTTNVALGYQAWQARSVGRRASVLLALANGSSAPTTWGNAMLLLTYDGFTFYELYRDTATTGASKGFAHVVGPTASGKVVAAESDSRQTNFSRAVFTLPTPSLPRP